MIDYSKFRKSLRDLQEQYLNYRSMRKAQPTFIQEAIVESIIWRYTICFDCMWEALRNLLTANYGFEESSDNSQSVFSFAHKHNLLTSSIDDFLSYTRARADVSRDYNGEEIQELLKLMPEFINDAVELYQIMSKNLLK